MMRYRRRLRIVSLMPAVGVAGPVLGQMTRRALSSPQASSLGRGPIMQVALGGAIILLLATIGLLILSRQHEPFALPKLKPFALPKLKPRAVARFKPRAVPEAVPSDLTRWLDSVDALADPEPLNAPAVQERSESEVQVHRYQVALGDDWIEVVLAPALGEPAGPRAESTLPAAAPYLAWAPLPYDVPDNGVAFVCVGASDDGCLFVDLAAASGAISVTGDTDAAVRLAESIVYQLCSSTSADQASSVVLVGRTIPEPYPANATSVATLSDLERAGINGSPDSAELVLCELKSNEDASMLARYAADSPRRVVPIVLGYLPGAAWSFTAMPSTDLDEGLQLSSLVGSLSLLS
jgi:hypothetical protein